MLFLSFRCKIQTRLDFATQPECSQKEVFVIKSIGNKAIMAKNLKYYVEQSGKDRKELAKILGFPYSTFTGWLNGEKYPRIDKIEIIANYFGIQMSDLIEEHPTVPQADEVSEERREFLQFIDSVPDAELDRLKRMILLALKRDD